MKLKLPDSVASSQDVSSLMAEVHDFARWFLHESIKVDANVKHVTKSPDLSLGAKDLIHEWGVKKPLTEQSLDELIDILKKYTDDAPVITLTLAAPPTNDIKSILVAWCRKNLAQNILVSFQFNTALLGGMVVRCGSHIFDWSFRRQILAARENFPGVLRRV